jgi:MoaA/NifB/PqqE/SkfB family radical SAM enzyme
VNFKAFFNTLSTRVHALPIVILYVTEGCNLRCITCSYRQPAPNELTLDELEQLADSLVSFGLRHIVFSGGEPLLRRDFPEICGVFKRREVKQTLLTNGLLLEKRLSELDGMFSEIIVSIDGPDEETHDAIRGVHSFQQIVKGVRRALTIRDGPEISIRTVVQKRNFRRISDMVEFAKSVGVSRISFLAADVLSDSFGRDRLGPVAPNETIMLDEEETTEFREIINKMVTRYRDEIQSGFISESEKKLFHLVHYFEALIGKSSFPRNTCNAPMVSAVITSTGNVQPCYFLPSFGQIKQESLPTILNNPQAISAREKVRSYSLERCHTCVCTLHVSAFNALADRF